MYDICGCGPVKREKRRRQMKLLKWILTMTASCISSIAMKCFKTIFKRLQRHYILPWVITIKYLECFMAIAIHHTTERRTRRSFPPLKMHSNSII